MDGRIGQAQRRSRPASRRAARGRPVPSRLTIAARGEGRRRTERQTADRPDVLLELRRRGAFDRPVAAVVDSRGELVDDELAVRHEEQLGGQRPDHAHRHRQPLPEVGGTLGDLGRDRRGRHGFGQDARVVRVACQREGGRTAVEAARHDDRDLHVERHLGLGQEHARRRAGRAARARHRGPPTAPTRIWLRPSYPPVVALTRSGSPSSSAAAGGRPSSGPRARARPRRRPPRRSDARRCGPGSRAAAAGRAGPGTTPSRASTTATATCSSSYVTTSLKRPSRSAPPTSS